MNRYKATETISVIIEAKNYKEAEKLAVGMLKRTKDINEHKTSVIRLASAKAKEIKKK